MAEQPEQPSGLAPLPLPDSPDLDWLRKQAKRRLLELRKADPGARLADAQLELARRHGFPSWRALKAHVDSLTVDGRLFDAAREGDAGALEALLDPSLRDGKHDGDAAGWARHFGRPEIVGILEAPAARP